jgi:hypothetical protein
MTKITITGKAKCKDCRYCQSFYVGIKLTKRHRCSNPESERYGVKYIGKTIRKNDLVCDKWKPGKIKLYEKIIN